MQTSSEAMCKIQAKSTHTSTKVKKYINKNFSKPPIPSNQKSSIKIFSQQKWWNNLHKKRKEKISSLEDKGKDELTFTCRFVDIDSENIERLTMEKVKPLPDDECRQETDNESTDVEKAEMEG